MLCTLKAKMYTKDSRCRELFTASEKMLRFVKESNVTIKSNLKNYRHGGHQTIGSSKILLMTEMLHW